MCFHTMLIFPISTYVDTAVSQYKKRAIAIFCITAQKKYGKFFVFVIDLLTDKAILANHQSKFANASL